MNCYLKHNLTNHQPLRSSKLWLTILLLVHAYRAMDARGKFGEHERRVRVARGAVESNSSFVSAPQTSQVNEIYDEKAEHPGENRKKNR